MLKEIDWYGDEEHLYKFLQALTWSDYRDVANVPDFNLSAKEWDIDTEEIQEKENSWNIINDL